MSQTWHAVYVANPVTTFQSTDLFYLSRSPYAGTAQDCGFAYSSLVPVTTKGDLFTFSTVNARLAVASGDGKFLQVSSGAATGLAWSTATIPSTATSTGTILRSDGTNWVATTATYPATTTVSQILYSSSANVVAGLATANSAVLVTGATGVPVMSGTLTNGQVVIGSTGATPTAGTLTAGTGISITNGAASITIATVGAGITWNNVTGTSASMAVDNGYVSSNAGLVTLTLPATAVIGDVVKVRGSLAGGWLIAQNAGQTIHVGSVASTVGAGGSVASANRYDAIDLTCIVANTDWSANGVQSAGLTIV